MPQGKKLIYTRFNKIWSIIKVRVDKSSIYVFLYIYELWKYNETSCWDYNVSGKEVLFNLYCTGMIFIFNI